MQFKGSQLVIRDEEGRGSLAHMAPGTTVRHSTLWRWQDAEHARVSSPLRVADLSLKVVVVVGLMPIFHMDLITCGHVHGIQVAHPPPRPHSPLLYIFKHCSGPSTT